MAQELKYTRNFFTRLVGLKIDGARILRNNYISIEDGYANTKNPIIIAEIDQDKFIFLNAKTKLSVVADSIVTSSVPVYREYFDGYESMDSDIYSHSQVLDVCVKRGGHTYLYKNRKEINTEEKYARIERLIGIHRDGDIFVAIDKKTLQPEIVHNLYGPKTVSFNDIHSTFNSLRANKIKNPYLYLLLDASTPKDISNNYFEVKPQEVKDNINAYFANLLKDATTTSQKNSILQEKANCIESVVKHFSNQLPKINAELAAAREEFKLTEKTLADIEQLPKYYGNEIENIISKTKDKLRTQEKSVGFLESVVSTTTLLEQDFEKAFGAAEAVTGEQQSKQTYLKNKDMSF